ncbi:MAG TPA: peptide-binding protein [Desulfobacterales bacterium]|nr:peptide-binding protein [Desulfobacterales bacterium]
MRSLTFILIFCLCAAAVQARMLSVTGGKVNLRTGPGNKYAVRWEYGRGFPVRVLKRRGNWYKVKDFEGDSGWIYRKLLSSRPHVIVKRKVVNIRTGPGSRYRLLGKANYGVVFLTLGKKRGWIKVKHAHGLIGWIRRDLLWGW